MRKPTTGEPCAGEPHARFGGRGGRKPFPTPIVISMFEARDHGQQIGLRPLRRYQAQHQISGAARAVNAVALAEDVYHGNIRE